MAKTIIIIEDTDKKTASFAVQVLKLQTADERDAADTSAILIGDHLAAALAHSISKLRPKTTALAMQSGSRH